MHADLCTHLEAVQLQLQLQVLPELLQSLWVLTSQLPLPQLPQHYSQYKLHAARYEARTFRL